MRFDEIPLLEYNERKVMRIDKGRHSKAMGRATAEVVICGAGIAGIATAYHLAVKHRVRDVVLIDERPPLSLTSDKSTECYRNWWPGPGDAMISLMNRSIDILEELARESDNFFHLNRRGYLFALMRRPSLWSATQTQPIDSYWSTGATRASYDPAFRVSSHGPARPLG